METVFFIGNTPLIWSLISSYNYTDCFKSVMNQCVGSTIELNVFFLKQTRIYLISAWICSVMYDNCFSANNSLVSVLIGFRAVCVYFTEYMIFKEWYIMSNYFLSIFILSYLQWTEFVQLNAIYLYNAF